MWEMKMTINLKCYKAIIFVIFFNAMGTTLDTWNVGLTLKKQKQPYNS